MTGILIKKGKCRDRQAHTERMACEDEGRDRSDTSTCQGTLKIPSKSPEVRGEAGNRFFFKIQNGTNSANMLSLTFGLQNCQTIYFCCLSHSVYVTLL